MKKLSGKCGVVTGAASGLGYGLALALAERGMNLVIADWDAEGADRAATAARAKGVDAVAVETDVSSLDTVQHLADVAYERHGGVQLLVNNAAVSRPGRLWEISAEDWQWVMDINVTGVINGLIAFLPRMMAQSDERHIAITSSTNGLWTMPKQGAYNMTKYALVGLSEALADDLAPHGITVSVICPGPMRTRLGANSRPPSLGGQSIQSQRTASDRPEKLRQMLATWPTLEPEEAGRIACNGIEEGEFWILTHAEGLEEIEARHQGLKEAFERRAAKETVLRSST
jgi:NAD(P)-dependent dehydrogenase (short-subunit alcohol dehydrogenase family)